MTLLCLLVFLGPFFVVLLDSITAQDITSGRRVLSVVTFVASLVVLFFGKSESWPLVLIIPTVLAMVYSRGMHGFASYLVVLPCLAYVSFFLAVLVPTNTNFLFRLHEILTLPMFAMWLLPLPLIWHLWHTLPLAYDSLRKGQWSETGVPLIAKHRMLAAIVLVLTISNIFFYLQWLSLRELARTSAQGAIIQMHFELGRVNNMLNNPPLYDRAAMKWHVEAYQSASSRLISTLQHSGVRADQFDRLSRGIADGMMKVLERSEVLLEDEQETFKSAIAAIEQGLSQVLSNGNRLLTKKTYVQAAEVIISQLQNTEAPALFNIRYP